MPLQDHYLSLESAAVACPPKQVLKRVIASLLEYLLCTTLKKSRFKHSIFPYIPTKIAAPHQNGCSEALVKGCKFALKKTIGDRVLTPFELYTCVLEVANLMNQRPIGRIPNDPDDGSYLCPNDMLLGRASSEVPQGPFRETKNPRHRVEFVQRIVDSFWKCWNRELFPLLVPRRSGIQRDVMLELTTLLW